MRTPYNSSASGWEEAHYGIIALMTQDVSEFFEDPMSLVRVRDFKLFYLPGSEALPSFIVESLSVDYRSGGGSVHFS